VTKAVPFPRQDRGHPRPPLHAVPWPDPPVVEVILRERLGRCPSCAKRIHKCVGGSCNCPRPDCADIQRVCALVTAEVQRAAELPRDANGLIPVDMGIDPRNCVELEQPLRNNVGRWRP